ncbi:hypothetical protein [Senegalia massiliensis]|uniref:hypothetical protein n=1 Tax=Senegalia massiliensis TaxID=1720316 RepID=UPI001362C3E7|nr:hypothetical protein [Senegalia massiliensis]
MYYCNKIYPKINLFERKIREFILIILTKSFGVNWYTKTVNDDLKSEIKNKQKE